MKITLVLLILFTLPYGNIFCQDGWELSKEGNGIRVYTGTMNHSSFKSVKVDCFLEGTIDKLINVLKNVDGNSHWVYNTKQTHLVKNISDNEFIYYAETSLPWPLRNRDMAINMLFEKDNGGNTLTVKATGVKEAAPEQEGKVRVPYFNGLWEVSRVDEKHITIHYQLSVDPGGSVPSWAYNMFVSKGPYKTFNNLAELLKD
jgi:START domain